MADGAHVAYLLKGFPRISETFVASEVVRVEQRGVPLRLFVLKPADEVEQHPVVAQITAVAEYLPATTSLSETNVVAWLARNVRPFLPALGAVARRRPRALCRAAGQALAQAVRARRGRFGAPRKVYLKEFLYAVELADRLHRGSQVRHLHAHFAHGCTTVAWLAATITGLPFSFTAHAKDIYAGDLNPAGLLARKVDAAAFVVTCTDANARHLRALAPGATVHRIYHGLGVDMADLVGARRPAGAVKPHGPARLLAVGRLVPKKGFDTFVRACAHLRDAGVEFHADIAGESGPDGAMVRTLVRDLGLERHVRLLGPQRPAQLHRLYRDASIFSLACRVADDGDRDGIPNVLVEAMACSTAVVASGVSGIPELVRDGVNGLLVPPDDPSALAAAWMRLLDDPGLARRLSAAGQRTVARDFDGAVGAQRLAALFGSRGAPRLEVPA